MCTDVLWCVVMCARVSMVVCSDVHSDVCAS